MVVAVTAVVEIVHGAELRVREDEVLVEPIFTQGSADSTGRDGRQPDVRTRKRVIEVRDRGDQWVGARRSAGSAGTLAICQSTLECGAVAHLIGRALILAIGCRGTDRPVLVRVTRGACCAVTLCGTQCGSAQVDSGEHLIEETPRDFCARASPVKVVDQSVGDEVLAVEIKSRVVLPRQCAYVTN